MHPTKAIILDTETTGLKAPQPIEVAYICLPEIQHCQQKDGLFKPQSIYNERFRPTKPIEAGARKVHHITFSMLANKPFFALDLLEIPPSTNYIIAHNLPYDWRVLGKPVHLGLRGICTLKVAKILYDKPHKLQGLVDRAMPHLKDRYPNHSAINDCFDVLLLLSDMMALSGSVSWADLYDIGGTNL